MRCVLVIMLLSAATVFAIDSTNLEYQSGENPNNPHVTDDEDLNDDGSGSGMEDFDPTTYGVTETTATNDFDVSSIPVDEVEHGRVDADEKEKKIIVVKEEVDVNIEIDEEPDLFAEVKKTPTITDPNVHPEVMLKTSSVFESGHFLTAAIIGGCIGFLFAVALIMLLLYRMRKKDEGSYALDDQKKHGAPPAYQYTQGQEYYA